MGPGGPDVGKRTNGRRIVCMHRLCRTRRDVRKSVFSPRIPVRFAPARSWGRPTAWRGGLPDIPDIPSNAPSIVSVTPPVSGLPFVSGTLLALIAPSALRP